VRTGFWPWPRHSPGDAQRTVQGRQGTHPHLLAQGFCKPSFTPDSSLAAPRAVPRRRVSRARAPRPEGAHCRRRAVCQRRRRGTSRAAASAAPRGGPPRRHDEAQRHSPQVGLQGRQRAGEPSPRQGAPHDATHATHAPGLRLQQASNRAPPPPVPSPPPRSRAATRMRTPSSCTPRTPGPTSSRCSTATTSPSSWPWWVLFLDCFMNTFFFIHSTGITIH
jgi:hypothetical protein